MQQETVSVVMVGIGGFGASYLQEIFSKHNNENGLVIKGAVDPAADKAEYFSLLRKKQIPVYSSLEEFYQTNTAQLAVISSPIQFHCTQSIAALSRGSKVLCEKPLSASIEEGLKMIKARDKTGIFLDIGYQWSHSRALLEFKSDVLAGVLGKPLTARTAVVWPRDNAYYNRNNWAGRIHDHRGRMVLDSVANNAAAHHLHNMFFVLGDEINKSCSPQSLSAELYRLNDIENYDTAVTRIITRDKVKLLYYATHAAETEVNWTTFAFEFEKARVVFGDLEEGEPGQITALFTDGRKKMYGNPDRERKRKLWLAVEAVKEDDDFVFCGPEAALPQTIAVNAMQKAGEPVENFPERIREFDRDESRYQVKGLADIIAAAYEQRKLFSEMGIDWAHSGKKVTIDYGGTGITIQEKKN